MIDQANNLRQLVMQVAGEPLDWPCGPVKTVLVAGGKGGVGTTTVAVNLAVAAAQQGTRTVLVDADPDGPDVQNLCRLRQRHTIADVLRGRRTLGETLQRGPGGTLILPGAWADADLADASAMNQNRFMDQLAGLSARADLVVLDGGNGLHPFTRRLWQTCQELVLVASPESSAVLDTYAALKVALDPAWRPRIHLLVNLCGGEDEAAEVYGRIRRSCQRFLGFDLPHCLWLPADANLAASGRQGVPFALGQTRSPAARALQQLARMLNNAPPARLEEPAEAAPARQETDDPESFRIHSAIGVCR